MAIRNPRFTGQFNAPDARFNVPTGSVSSRVPTNTKLMKQQNILDVIGGIQKIATGISDRYSASEFQNLTSEFEREKIDLYDKTTSDVNNYNDFATNGMKGHAALVKKYEKLAKEKNINPNFSTKLKTFTLSSGDSFKNSLVSNARRIEPTILNRKAQNQASQAITNLRGAHPNANPNTRAIGDELMLSLDRSASVIGEEKVQTLKRGYLNTAEKAFFQTVVRDNPGFFIEDHKNYTGFKFAYTDQDDIAQNVAQAKSIDKAIQREIQKNKIIDLSAIENTVEQITSQNSVIAISLYNATEIGSGSAEVLKNIDDKEKLVINLKNQIDTNTDLKPEQRKALLKDVNTNRASIINQKEFINVIDLAKTLTESEEIEQLKKIYMQTGSELEGFQAQDFEKNLPNRMQIFKNVESYIQENKNIRIAVTEIANGGVNLENPNHEKGLKYITNNYPISGDSLKKIGEYNPNVTEQDVKNLTPTELMSKTFFKTTAEGNGTLGQGAIEASKLMGVTGVADPQILTFVSKIINSQSLGEKDDVKRGNALSWLITLRNNNLINDDVLTKYDLLDDYQLYHKDIGSGFYDISTIGSEIRRKYDTVPPPSFGITGEQELTPAEKAQSLYAPDLQNGQSHFGRDMFDALVRPQIIGMDSIVFKGRNLLKIKNALDGKRSEKRIKMLAGKEEAEFFSNPDVMKSLTSMHKRTATDLISKGYAPLQASKIAAQRVAQILQPSLLTDQVFALNMPDNQYLNESGDTSIEHGNNLAFFLIKYYQDNPEAGRPNLFDDVFRNARVTETSNYFRPSWVLGDKKKIRIDAISFAKPGSSFIKPGGEKARVLDDDIYIPFTGEKVMAYVDAIKFNEGSDREFKMINPKKLKLQFNGKNEGGQPSWKIYANGELLTSVDGNPLLYVPSADDDNRRLQAEAKYDRKRAGMSNIVNEIMRKVTGTIQQ